MPLQLNLLELREEPIQLKGTLPVSELVLGLQDELMHFVHPLEYDLEAELLGDAILVQGSWRLPVECECARCLKRFLYAVDMPDWSLHLPLTGDDKVSHVDDLVDLTPPLREDILLALPQHPVCGSECGGPKLGAAQTKNNTGTSRSDQSSGAWAALDKLKF